MAFRCRALVHDAITLEWRRCKFAARIAHLCYRHYNMLAYTYVRTV